MRSKGWHLLGILLLKSIGMIVFVGYLFFITPAEAAVTIQPLSGTVEVFFKGEQAWKPFSDTTALNVGDQVRIGKAGSADLLGEDQSVLHLGEETQLAINELEFSKVQKARVFRFKLFWGTVTSEVVELDFKQDIFELETDTSVTTAKSSEGIVVASRDEPRSDVIVKQGFFEIRQTGKGMVNISGLVDKQEGLTFRLNSVGARILLEVQRPVREITLESNIPLSLIRALIGYNDNSVKIENASNAPLNVSFRKNTTTLEQEEAATFGIPADEEIFVEAVGKANAIFWFKQMSFFVFGSKGTIDVNGQEISPGPCGYFSIEDLLQEEPVAPPAPISPTPRGSYSPPPAPKPNIGSPIFPE